MIFPQEQTHPTEQLVLLDRSNKTSWVFPILKSTNHFLPQSTVSLRSYLSSEANSSCCHRQMPDHRIESRIISIDSNITDNIITCPCRLCKKFQPNLGFINEKYGFKKCEFALFNYNFKKRKKKKSHHPPKKIQNNY